MRDVKMSAMASQITSLPKLHVTGLCAGNSSVTGEFPAQKASNAENASIWWRHHGSWPMWYFSHRRVSMEVDGNIFSVITVTSYWARWRLKSPATRFLLYRLCRCGEKKTSNSASLVFVMGIHRWPVNSPHKEPVTRKIFPLHDVIMVVARHWRWYQHSENKVVRWRF